MTKRRTCSLDRPWYGCSASVAISQRTTPKDLPGEKKREVLGKGGWGREPAPVRNRAHVRHEPGGLSVEQLPRGWQPQGQDSAS